MVLLMCDFDRLLPARLAGPCCVSFYEFSRLWGLIEYLLSAICRLPSAVCRLPSPISLNNSADTPDL